MELPDLKKKRGNVQQTLTSFTKYFDPIKTKYDKDGTLSEKTIIELKLRHLKFNEIIGKFESIQEEIEFICSIDNLEAEYKEREEFMNLYMSYSAGVIELLQKFDKDDKESKKSSTISSQNNEANVTNNISDLKLIKLPPITCPSFNCEFEKWLEFKDTFLAVFDENTSLSDIQKYHYLRSCLGENALKIIHSLEFSSKNYKEAWGLLCDRFDNSRLLINNHLKNIFNCSTINKESASDIRELIDTINKHLRALKTLQVPTEHWDLLIIYIVYQKLDKYSAREWESQNKKELPTLKAFFKFLNHRADFLETVENLKSKESYRTKDTHFKSKNVSLLSKGTYPKCNFCKQDHSIYVCEKFLSLNTHERWNKIKELQLCANCLCTGHTSRVCKSKNCKFCPLKHSSLLHHNKPDNNYHNSNINQNVFEQTANLPNDVQLTTTNNSTTLTSKVSYSHVLLSTALIDVCDNEGKTHKAHAILDSGSQSSFITKEFCKRLGMKVESANMSISGINNIKSTIKNKSNISIKSSIREFSATITCFVIPYITDNLPTFSFDISGFNIPANITLANPEFNVSQPIDMLLGADIFWHILCDGKVYLGKNKPILINSVFGYIISGNVSPPSNKVTCNFSLQTDLEHFWKIEEVPISGSLTQEEVICEEHFKNTFTRNLNGKFVVKLPLKVDSSGLGETKDIAIKRLLNLERRFENNSDLKDSYILFMNEYQELGHMREINYEDSKFRYFLPHHGVYRNSSLTTKLRVVFDGSVKGNSGNSLNDIMYPGPAIQNDIFEILIRFREHQFVVIADIAKMYRQILVHPDDTYLQNVVWRESKTNKISIFELLTVTYGTSSAPYLAIRCLKQLGLENAKDYPIASNIISRDFYVDDLITGFDNESEAIKICNNISTILSSASFQLRKWMSNSQTILNNLPNTSDEFNILDIGKNDQVKTLGIQWASQSDTLRYNVNLLSDYDSITKRNLLSCIARIFDPLGLISPCTILLKIIIQQLWSKKLNWDDSVPEDILIKWSKFKGTFHYLDSLKIPRPVITKNSISIQLHGFSDASKDAYSAAIYVRSVNSDGRICVNLLCAKTRVAPLNGNITIPRLELCGAVMLSRLMQLVKTSLTIQVKDYYWCDSTIVLSWLQIDASKLQVFVSHRVAEIQQKTDVTSWSHVQSKNNPADCASRGLSADKLVSCTIWWAGPQFLYEGSNWPIVLNKINQDLPEIRKGCKMANITKVDSFQLFSKFSQLTRLTNVVAYCLRFIYNSKNKREKLSGPLSVSELDNSMSRLVKLSQLECFKSEISLLKGEKELNNSNRLLSLSPFLDANELLRVGGRLKYSNLSFTEKHPLLLDSKHLLTKLIFEYKHKHLCHPGPQLLLSSIRQKYWPISGMTLAKITTRQCIKCFRAKPKPLTAIMGNLPNPRVQYSYPFFSTGVDYAGPIILRDRKGRPYKTYKAYISIFICLATKALHIELVTDLSTNGFITAFRRFTSRRGTPAHMYSDNGSNFVGASRELKELYTFLRNSNDEFVSAFAQERITWHFIPPSSPNFGGLWESNIKGIKVFMYRIIGSTILTYEEFSTLLVQIEGILNSRPLHPMSSDPNDISALTPSHFLIGRPLNSTPDVQFKENTAVNRLTRFQLLQQLQQSFWRRWSQYYLTELQKRYKWKKGNPQLQVGTLVILKNENVPPSQWLLGRIVETYPGKDGISRVATVKTIKGLFKRCVSKLCPLPLPDESE